MSNNNENIVIDTALVEYLASVTGTSVKGVFGNLFALSEEQVEFVRNKDTNRSTVHSRRKIRYPGTSIDLAFKTKREFVGRITTEVYFWKGNKVSMSRSDVENMIVEEMILGYEKNDVERS